MRFTPLHWLMLFAVMTVVCGVAMPVLAAPITPPDCSAYVGLTNRLVGCLRETITQAAEVFFDEVGPWLSGAITTVIAIAVAIYGCLLAMGMVEKVGRDTFVLLLKIAAVTYFTANSAFIYVQVTGLMDAAGHAAISYTPPTTDLIGSADTQVSNIKCYYNMINMQQTIDESAPTDSPVVAPWLAMDCLLDTVIGIRVTTTTSPEVWYNEALNHGTDDTKSNRGLSRSLAFLFFGSMQSSIIGVILAAIGGAFIYGLLMMIIKAMFTYITAYMGIALLCIVSPLIIPLILFKETKGYFDKWAKMLISMALQPIIILVFISMAIAAIDLAAFSGKYSIVYRIAGEASTAAKFDLNKYLTVSRTATGAVDTTEPPAATSKPIVIKSPRKFYEVKAETPQVSSGTATDKITEQSRDDGGVANNLMNSKCIKSLMSKDADLKKICSSSYPVLVWQNTIDWEMMAKARGIAGPVVDIPDAVKTANDAKDPKATDDKLRGQQIMKEILAAVLFCAVVAYLMSGLLAVVPLVAHDLLGDFGQTPNLGNFAKVPGSEGTTNPFTKISNNFNERMQSMTGKRP